MTDDRVTIDHGLARGILANERERQGPPEQPRDYGPWQRTRSRVIVQDDDLSANLPMSVKDAALFLGVSPQTVYLWVERKQIPHLRVMGRNIRFLRSDLEPFRAQFKQEVENGTTAQT
jgi:excisionase family DNA binding protein